MNLKIRSARPDDAPFLAWLIMTAGRAHVNRGIWEVILNLAKRDCLSFLECLAVTRTPHLFHYSCYLIAETEAGPVSGIGGLDPDIYPRLLQTHRSTTRGFWNNEEHSYRSAGGQAAAKNNRLHSAFRERGLGH